MFSYAFRLWFSGFLVSRLLLMSSYKRSIYIQSLASYQQDFKKKIMMVFGACLFLAVAEPTGLNPLEIAANIVSLSVICHLSFSKLKEVVQKYYQ